MLYYKCPTCKTILADKQIIFEHESDIIKEDPNLTIEQKDELLMALPAKLKLIRYCCKMRLITSLDDFNILN